MLSPHAKGWALVYQAKRSLTDGMSVRLAAMNRVCQMSVMGRDMPAAFTGSPPKSGPGNCASRKQSVATECSRPIAGTRPIGFEAGNRPLGCCLAAGPVASRGERRERMGHVLNAWQHPLPAHYPARCPRRTSTTLFRVISVCSACVSSSAIRVATLPTPGPSRCIPIWPHAGPPSGATSTASPMATTTVRAHPRRAGMRRCGGRRVRRRQFFDS